MKKVLIVHLGSNGDCLMSTTIARQIKNDYPDCNLTWAISYKCKQVIDNNPFIDTIWEIKHDPKESSSNGDLWVRVKAQAEKRKIDGDFDEIIYAQVQPDNPYNFDGATRSTTFRVYGKPITVSITPVIRLYDFEQVRVKQFSEKYHFSKYKHVILCECAPSSNQSFLNSSLMIDIANDLTKEIHDVIFVISTHLKLETNNNRVIDASELTYRENAELSKYCTLFIGCSSGITWLLTSDWAKKLPTIQLLNSKTAAFEFASVAYDFKYWGISYDHILESSRIEPTKIKKIISEGMMDFSKTRNIYHEEFKPNNSMIVNYIYKLYPNSTFPLLAKCVTFYKERNNLKSSDVFSITVKLLYKLNFNIIYYLILDKYINKLFDTYMSISEENSLKVFYKKIKSKIYN